MKLHFLLPYRTRWGEEIKAVLHLSGFGLPRRERVLSLRTEDGNLWKGSLDLDLPAGAELIYHYAVYENGVPVRREWRSVPRKLTFGVERADGYTLNDAWRDAPALAALYSTAYTGRGPAHRYKTEADAVFGRTVVLRAGIPQAQEGEEVLVCGAPAALGSWNPSRAVPMQKTALHEWSVSLDADALSAVAAYKYIIRTRRGEIYWEEGPNRALPAQLPGKGEAAVSADHWPVFDRPLWRAAGVVLPVFSIRSRNSWGAGDFGDLKLLADWAALTAQKAIQLLPVNDTTLTGTWTDSYPYNAVSVYALHPMYADLNALPALPNGARAQAFARERARLNALAQVDYEAVNRLKLAYLRLIFQRDGEKTLASAEFKEFFARNKRWLVPYAAFSYLRDRFGTPDFTRWPRFAVYDRERVELLCAPSGPAYGQISFYYYVQYLLHVQLLDAAEYARKKGILLKGDIPIGVSRYSADAWVEPKLFHLNAQAGAPPDPFSATGQNWGFPTYNWEEMAKDGYAWWTRRFEKMAEYFDAYRVDHILGFFRIWEIPSHSVQGLLGQFSPALPMDKAEIEGFGVSWREDFIKPFISPALLEETFGPYAAEVRAAYLTPDGSALLPAYDTQRKVEKVFAGKEDEKSRRIRDGLYALLNQVLFVPDRVRADAYHPRIAVLEDKVYQALPPAQREAFARLYNHYFYERHNDFWAAQAMKKLPALTQSTRMLPCAEDLGMIPACVPGVLNALKMLSLEIERMPKEPGRDFADPAHYPWMSVCCAGTHDMNPLRAWWRENRALTQKFYNEALGRPGEAPLEAEADVCEQVLKRQLDSPSLLCLLSFQDWTSADASVRNPDAEAERINVPANARHYWRYRMHLPLEELMQNQVFTLRLRELVRASGR